MTLVVIVIAVLVLLVWLLIGFVFALVVGPFLAFGTPPERARTPSATRERER